MKVFISKYLFVMVNKVNDKQVASRFVVNSLVIVYPGEYSIIDLFLGNDFWVFSCPVWSTVLQFCARLMMHTLNYLTVCSQ